MYKLKVIQASKNSRRVLEILTAIPGVDEEDAHAILADLPTYAYVGDDAVFCETLAASLTAEGAAIEATGIESQSKETSSGERGAGQDVKWLYGNVDWFSPEDQPPSVDDLPTELAEARSLADQALGDNFDRIVSLLSPFVVGLCIPENVSNADELFDLERLLIPEISHAKLRVVGFEFGSRNLPLLRVEAEFLVPVLRSFDTVDLASWQERNALLVDGLVFNWDIPILGDRDDLDFSLASHSGMEFYLTDGPEL